jgi:hypothetical protein
MLNESTIIWYTLDFEEYIGNLLAAFVSLRVFEIVSRDHYPIEGGLSFIRRISDRVPHFMNGHFNDYFKRVGREWVICDETECRLVADRAVWSGGDRICSWKLSDTA